MFHTQALTLLFLSVIPYLFLLQDTTDYVAYVAKDPVNRRGELISQ